MRRIGYETRGQCASSPFSLRLCHASRSPQRGHGARRARHGRVRWALAPPSTTPPQVQCFLGAAFCVLHLQPDCVVVCLIGFVEWLCSRRWCLQCFGWALFIGSFATCSTCCTWLAAAWLCTPPAFGVCCFNSGSCRTLNSQRLARATEAQRVTYSASRRLEGHLRHRWQHSNSRRAHPPHCLHARAHPAWWRGNGAGCLRAGQVSCTLNTDRTRDSAGRKVGLRTTTKGEQPHPVVTNPIPLPRASLS